MVIILVLSLFINYTYVFHHTNSCIISLLPARTVHFWSSFGGLELFMTGSTRMLRHCPVTRMPELLSRMQFLGQVNQNQTKQ